MTGRYALRFGALGYLAFLLLFPVGLVFWRAFEHGLQPAWEAVRQAWQQPRAGPGAKCSKPALAIRQYAATPIRLPVSPAASCRVA